MKSAKSAKKTEDFLKKFTESLTEHEQQLNERILAIQKREKESKIEEIQMTEEETVFSNKLSEKEKKYATENAKLKKDLQQWKTIDDKLTKTQKECEESLEATQDARVIQLENEDTTVAEKQFGDIFSTLLNSLNSLSFHSMNVQLEQLKKSLTNLYSEKEELTQVISKQNTSISELEKSLGKTFGVTYKERNVLRCALLTQVSKVRQEYQKSRLLEESLRAKLTG